MPVPVFYPPLSSIVQLDFLPEQLDFVNTGLSSLLDDLYYKDLQVSKSARGDGAFYSLSLMSKKRLDLELPGTNSRCTVSLTRYGKALVSRSTFSKAPGF